MWTRVQRTVGRNDGNESQAAPKTAGWLSRGRGLCVRDRRNELVPYHLVWCLEQEELTQHLELRVILEILNFTWDPETFTESLILFSLFRISTENLSSLNVSLRVTGYIRPSTRDRYLSQPLPTRHAANPTGVQGTSRLAYG